MRLCNPCVPDPNTAPPQSPGTPATMSPRSSHQRSRSSAAGQYGTLPASNRHGTIFAPGTTTDQYQYLASRSRSITVVSCLVWAGRVRDADNFLRAPRGRVQHTGLPLAAREAGRIKPPSSGYCRAVHPHHTPTGTAGTGKQHRPRSNELSRRLPKLQRRMSAQSATVSSRLRAYPTLRLFENPTSPCVSRHIAPTEHPAAEMKQLPLQPHHDGRACTRIQQPRRTALTMPSAPFVSRNLLSGFPWHD